METRQRWLPFVAILTFTSVGFHPMSSRAAGRPGYPLLSHVPAIRYQAPKYGRLQTKAFLVGVAATAAIAKMTGADWVGHAIVEGPIVGLATAAFARGVRANMSPFGGATQLDLRSLVANELKPGLTENGSLVEYGYLTKRGQLFEHEPTREQASSVEKVLVLRNEWGASFVAIDNQIYSAPDSREGVLRVRRRVAGLQEKMKTLRSHEAEHVNLTDRGLHNDAAKVQTRIDELRQELGLSGSK